MEKRPVPKNIVEGLTAYRALSKKFKREHRLKYALFRQGELKGVFDELDETYEAGYKYGDGDFFIRQIDAPPIDPGSLAGRLVTVDI